MMDQLGSLPTDSIVRATVILVVGMLLLISSLSTIAIMMINPALHDVIGFYLMSLATADLLCVLLIVPLSVYSSLTPQWHFGGDDSFLCMGSSYLQVVLLSATIYIYAWIGVDRYAAFAKPSRYECEHTLTRCKCWIGFSWITATLLSCPMIVAKMPVHYHPEFEMCLLSWHSTVAYSITLGVLVIFPSLFTVAFTSMAIFAAMRRPEELEDSQRSIVETDQNFIVCLFVLISFLLAWLPLVAVQFLPSHWLHPDDSAHLNFAFMWLAVGGSSAKLLIYSITNPEYRRSFFSTCLGSRRRRRRRRRDQQEQQQRVGENGARSHLMLNGPSHQVRRLDDNEGEEEGSSGLCSGLARCCFRSTPSTTLVSGPYMVAPSSAAVSAASAAHEEFFCPPPPPPQKQQQRMPSARREYGSFARSPY